MQTPPAAGERYPQIDGLRGVAILGVLLDHFGVPLPHQLSWGGLGVRFFFLLSGFFLTISILKDRERQGDANRLKIMGVYHIRRLLRLGPAFLVALGFGLLLGLPEVRELLFQHLTFTTIFYIVGLGYWPPYVSHFWSLCTQEQFYILFPFLLLYLKREWIVSAIWCCVAAAFVFRLLSPFLGIADWIQWIILPCVLDCFGTGALLAIGTMNQSPWIKRIPQFLPVPVSILLMLGLHFIALWIYKIGFSTPWAAFAGLFHCAMLALLLLVSLHRAPVLWNFILTCKPMVLLGQISYGVYIYHILTGYVIAEFYKGQGIQATWLLQLSMIAGAIFVALLSWNLIEKSILNIRPKLKRTTPKAS